MRLLCMLCHETMTVHSCSVGKQTSAIAAGSWCCACVLSTQIKMSKVAINFDLQYPAARGVLRLAENNSAAPLHNAL